ncbi:MULTISPECIES: hypothetical protein [Pandoraea]|uniref:Uncharacterized protein n=1 Tax=Pandoraea communis TaxID=2508297 RepID=A0A5E4VMN6_9BURK|nr:MULTISPECIES: hypothetical protein [Pandoraea]EON15614.1 hypothetical protein C266_00090 [Pandoraea sp. SD6-2]VVE13667.1 hypothetical protein PCO31110_02798 [Pandoraea communis]
MARLFGLLRTSFGQSRVRATSQARLSAVYGLSALSGPFASAPAIARSYTVPARARSTVLPRTLAAAVASATRRACPSGKAIKASRNVRELQHRDAQVTPADHEVRVYRDVSHIVMVGSIADICRKLDQAVGEQFCLAAV